MEFQLIDDGTLDTVVRWECPHCQEPHEERCSQEFAATYRDPDTGQLDLDALMATIDDLYCPNCDREWPTDQQPELGDQHAAALTYIERRLGYALNSLLPPTDVDDILAARDNINEALGYLKGYFKGELI